MLEAGDDDRNLVLLPTVVGIYSFVYTDSLTTGSNTGSNRGRADGLERFLVATLGVGSGSVG